MSIDKLNNNSVQQNTQSGGNNISSGNNTASPDIFSSFALAQQQISTLRSNDSNDGQRAQLTQEKNSLNAQISEQEKKTSEAISVYERCGPTTNPDFEIKENVRKKEEEKAKLEQLKQKLAEVEKKLDELDNGPQILSNLFPQNKQ